MNSKRKISKKTSSVILSSLKVKIITTDNKVVAAVQGMLAQMWRTVHSDAVSTTEVKDNKLSVWRELDLRVIARDAFIFNDNIVTQLAPNVNHRFFNAIGLLACLRKLDGKLGWRHRWHHWLEWHTRGLSWSAHRWIRLIG